MTTKFIRNLIEMGYSDDDIDTILKMKAGKEAAAAKPAQDPKPAPAPDPKPEAAPAPAPETNNDLIAAIRSLEQTIKASNLISSVLDTQNTEKSADDILAEMLSPKGGKN